MNDFKQINDNMIQFEIDTFIYNDTVISKVLYWLSDSYFVYRISQENNKQSITLERKQGNISNDEFVFLKTKLNQDFIDFKTRDIINHETKNVRDILYIKAFANCDDFEDYNLIQD